MQANSHNTKHRSTVYFPAMVTRKDQMSKQARFLVRMALACHTNGTSYDVKWERRGIGEGSFFAATLTAEGNIPMPKPFPKAPKTRTMATWKPSLYEASYRLEAAREGKEAKYLAGHVIEHSCGLSLVRFGDGSETGEIVCTAEKDAKDGWIVTHTRSGRGMGFTWRFNDAVSSLLAIAHYCDWHQDIEALKDDEGARKAQLLLRSESCQKRQDRENALQALERMGGPIEPPAMPEPPAKPTVRTRTTPMPVEGRIAAIPESKHAKLDSASREWSDWVKAGKPATEPTPVVAVPEVAATSAPEPKIDVPQVAVPEVAATSAPEPKIDVPQVADSPKTETPQVAPLPQVLHFDNGVRFVDVSQTERGWLMRARSRDGNIAVPTILFATRDEAVARAEKFIGAQVDAMPATVESPQPAAVEPAAPIAPKTETPQGIENQEAARKHAMMTATYSPEDNKLRLYSVGRLDPETYARVKAAGFAWAPKQGLFVAPPGDVRNADFLECTADELGQFDAVIMNPPFENGADIKHIQHAAGMLKPGGKLVAICANGPRQNEKLKPLADQWEELPAGTFAGTNVRAVLLTISKPKPAEPAAVAPAAQPAATNDTQQRIARLLAELKASRLPAPAGKLAVKYADGRIGYIPDPVAPAAVHAADGLAPSGQAKSAHSQAWCQGARAGFQSQALAPPSCTLKIENQQSSKQATRFGIPARWFRAR